MTQRKEKYVVTGYPAFILFIIPMVFGYIWIIKTLVAAVV